MTNSEYPIYLVSMKQDHERRLTLAARFPAYYPRMSLIEAVDGRILDAEQFYGHIVKPIAERRRLMLPGEVGCSLSHIKALEAFLASDRQAALILEDDIIGADREIEAVMTMAGALPEDGLLICGGQEGMPARKYVFGKTTNTDGLYQLAEFSNRHVFRTCSYVVTRQSAARIVAVHRGSLHLADAWECFFNGTDISLYFARLLSHPKELAGSHLESERALFGQGAVYGRPGLWARVRRRWLRIGRKLGALRCGLAGYRRVAR